MQRTDALLLAVELGPALDAAGLPYAITIDVRRVRELMVETMGADDERVRAWDVVRRLKPATV